MTKGVTIQKRFSEEKYKTAMARLFLIQELHVLFYRAFLYLAGISVFLYYCTRPIPALVTFCLLIPFFFFVFPYLGWKTYRSTRLRTIRTLKWLSEPAMIHFTENTIEEIRPTAESRIHITSVCDSFAEFPDGMILFSRGGVLFDFQKEDFPQEASYDRFMKHIRSLPLKDCTPKPYAFRIRLVPFLH